MNRNSWIKEKKQILIDHFLNKKQEDLNKISQESVSQNQNKIVTKFTPWAELIDQAKTCNTEIIQSSLDMDVCGFRLSDKKSQTILDIAFERKVTEILQELNLDFDYFESAREAIVDHILANRWDKRKLHELVKKIRLLDLDELPKNI